MPILLAFLACEKVIVSQGTNELSLIGIINDIYVPVIRSVPIPPNLTGPLRWNAVAIWFHASSDGDASFEVFCGVADDSDDSAKIALQSEVVTFSMRDQPVMRIFFSFTAFPVFKPGLCSLKLLVRRVGLKEWTKMADYPLVLHHQYYPA